MRKPTILRAVLLTVLFLAGANWAIHRLSDHSPARRQVDAVAHSSGMNCIVIGNSLLASGFDDAAFDQAAKEVDVSARSLNAAVGATLPVEHLLMLRLALRSNPHPSVVVYGFFDFQLTDPPVVRSEDLGGNRSIGVFLEPNIAKRFYIMEPTTLITFSLWHDVPMYVERGNAYGRVELMRRRLNRIGLDPSFVDRSGNRNFAELEAASSEAFLAHCTEAVEGNQPLSAPIQEIIRETHAYGGRAVFVEMPLPPSHIQEFYSLEGWHVYQSYLRTMLATEGVELVDASQWMSSTNDFADRLHLTAQGGAQFSEELARSIYGPGERN
jgi:hypothetical protein